MRPDRVPLYWTCGGEIMTSGGPLGLAVADERPSPGCRPLTPLRAAELQAFYALEAHNCPDADARQHCLACADALQSAIRRVGQWRRAA